MNKDEILIEIHNTEHNYTLSLFVEYFKLHKIENCRFDVSTDGDCPDIRISINGIVVYVFEIKHKADARASRDTKHLYNNFNKMLRQYPEVKKWFILVDHKKKSLRWNNTLKKKTMLWNLDPTLIGQMMHEGFSRGFETKYVSKDRFVQLMFDIINETVEGEIDIGVHYLEKKGAYKPKNKSRGRCSSWETSLPSYRTINPKKAYGMALKWPNMFEFVREGSIIVDSKTGKEIKDAEMFPKPSKLDLSEFIPNNTKGGKTKYWAIFVQETFGIETIAKVIKKRKKSKKKK